MSVRNVNFRVSNKEENFQIQKNKHIFFKKQNINDSFEKNSAVQDKSNNGKFDLSECAKNFIKGVCSPLTAIVEHPVITAGVVAGTAAACTLIPVLTPVMAVGFTALSALQLGKGVYDVVNNYKNGRYDQAEQSFNKVGQGTVGVAMSALGLKSSSKIAKEAKLMNELGTTSLQQAQKEAIALEVKNGSYLDALKEVMSLFTTKAGLKAAAAQFKPSNIMQRGKDALKFLFTKEEVTKVKKTKMKFKDTAEGKRRAGLSSEEIKAEIDQLVKESFDEYGVPEELRPKIKVTQDSNILQGGGYQPSSHTITINENSYREGMFDLPDLIKHEATHANEAILRQRLPFAEKERLTKEYFLNKIKNGDKENVITGNSNIMVGNETIKPPKLNSQLKSDFSKLAESKLYQTVVNYTDEELTAMVRPIVESNPEFIQGYENIDDAVNALSQYAKSHYSRYRFALDNASGFNTSKVDTSFLSELTADEKNLAIKSFIEGIDVYESNASNSKGIFNIGGDFNQYQFTPEEVLAQEKGNNFEISKLKGQLEKLRSQEHYDAAEEARLLDQIKKHELTIEYKHKGQEMYKLYTESINHPENEELAAKVNAMKSELKDINSKILNINMPLSDNFLGVDPYIRAIDYTAYQTKVRPEMGVTVSVPPSVTVVSDIIADEITEKNN